MEVSVFGVDGSKKGSVALPEVFAGQLRPDLVRKAVNAAQANRRQPYGAAKWAGRLQTAESWGPGRGASRVPRGTQRARATFAPSVVGGRRAHPPRAERDWSEKINKKERRAALRAALAATANAEVVRARGHKFEAEATPLVVEDELASIATTQALAAALGKIGAGPDLERARSGRHQRTGKGKLRGRRMRTPKSVLLVLHEKGPAAKAASNLPGVDFAVLSELNVERLAPGGDQGRLVVFTKSALEAVAEVTR